MKLSVVIGALGIALLLLSTVTAVPHSHSEPVMDHIHAIEDLQTQLENEQNTLGLEEIFPTGIFERLIQLITLIIQIVLNIVQIIQSIMSIISLIQFVIEALQTLIQVVQEFIALLQDLFNPSESILN